MSSKVGWQFLLAVLMVFFWISGYAQAKETKLEGVPVWNNLNAFSSATAQNQIGKEAGVRALANDIREGKAGLLQKGTKINVVRQDPAGLICVITIEGVSGLWYTLCDLLGE